MKTPSPRSRLAQLWARRLPGLEAREEGGFTLVELLITTIIMPLAIGSITLALIAIFSLQGTVANRLGDSGDAQAVSATFVKDVDSASLITTASSPTSPAPCGSSTQLLGLQWGNGFEISYVEVTAGTGTNTHYSIYRYLCQSGSSTPTSTSLVASDAPASLAHPTVSPASINTAAQSGWTTAVGVTGVVLSITAPASSYTYSLTASPATGPSQVNQSNAAQNTNTTCNFATAGTGTYASSLCFVDFTSFGKSGSPTCSSGGQKISAAIANTPYAINFCIADSGGPVAGAAIPTYYDPPTSEAFLGNNGFYTGIPGNPALYQTVEGTTSTVTVTNIQVTDSNGNAASGWELVAGDAESTDAGESISWTSNQTLALLPNSPTSPYGNDCNSGNPSSPNLTGLNTTSVTCSSTVSADKTGSVMLEALSPSTLTVSLVGSGLQAMFIGVLLP